MSTDHDPALEPMQLPMAPSHIRTVALAEASKTSDLVQSLSLEQWKQRSAVPDWTIGDVATHLNVTLALYSRLLNAVSSGKGGGTIWKTVGQIAHKVMPAASPALNAINSAIPRVLDRALAPEVLKGQFAASARSLQETLLHIGSEDYTRPVYYRGRAWPLSFFLANIVDELAIHGWDMVSRLHEDAHLSEGARSVLPWFFWSGTPFMVQRKDLMGTIAVQLDDPRTEIWWSFSSTGVEAHTGLPENASATITGASGIFCLVLTGRVPPDDALRATSLSVSGDRELARRFLGAWKIL